MKVSRMLFHLRHTFYLVAISLMIVSQSSHASAPLVVRQPSAIMQVVELPTGAKYHHRILPFNRRYSLERKFHYRDGFNTVYLTRAFPGKQYTLGFRYAANWRNQVKVMLFDRWPFDPEAHQIDLPSGMVLRGQSDQVELRWQISISPDSTGSLLYVVIEASNTLTKNYEGFPHDLFLAWPPIEARNEIGHGATYLQGPKNIMLTEQVPGEPVLLTNIEVGEPSPSSSFWNPPGDIITNGTFKKNLQHWSPIQNIRQSKQLAKILSVGRNGLVLHSTKLNTSVGVQQQLEVDVRHSSRLILQARVKIIKQSKQGLSQKESASPLTISVCYDDATGKSHCGKNAYTRRFYSRGSNNNKIRRNSQRIPQGMWFSFSDNLMRLNPPPTRIRSISIKGAGKSEWQSNIREIHLIKYRGSHE